MQVQVAGGDQLTVDRESGDILLELSGGCRAGENDIGPRLRECTCQCECVTADPGRNRDPAER